MSKTNHFMVSFDVVSLFTNIPLNETIDLAIDYIFKHRHDLTVSRSELKCLFEFATKQTHFLFNGDFDQIDGRRCCHGFTIRPSLSESFYGPP